VECGTDVALVDVSFGFSVDDSYQVVGIFGDDGEFLFTFFESEFKIFSFFYFALDGDYFTYVDY